MISNICYWIGKISKDKILHYLLSYIIFDFFLCLFERFNLSDWLNITLSLVIVSIAIIGKEVIDEKEYNGWDLYDILAGYLGVITKLVFLLIVIL